MENWFTAEKIDNDTYAISICPCFIQMQIILRRMLVTKRSGMQYVLKGKLCTIG